MWSQKMNREEMLTLWSDMWQEGNWVPSWPDSLAGLSAEAAAWTPDPPCHSIWAEVVHVTYWRHVTLRRIAGGDPPDEQEIARLEFAVPEITSDDAWTEAVAALKQTQDEIATAIQDTTQDVARIPYHLIHDAYHLGRITQLRVMRGNAPKF
jgi:hypothetical protein